MAFNYRILGLLASLAATALWREPFNRKITRLVGKPSCFVFSMKEMQR